MLMLVVQTLFFIAVAFALGYFAGCWFSSVAKGGRSEASGRAVAVTHEGAAKVATASEPAAPMAEFAPVSRPQPAMTPKPASEPAPAAPAEPVAAVSEPAKRPRKSASPKPAAAKSAAAPAKSGKSKAAPKPKKPAPALAATPDNLKQIKGIGPQNEAKLNAIGINSFAQIAAWTKKDQAEMGERLAFPGRIEREEWVSQAKTLAKGGSTDFAKRVAKGEVASSSGGASAKTGKKRS